MLGFGFGGFGNFGLGLWVLRNLGVGVMGLEIPGRNLGILRILESGNFGGFGLWGLEFGNFREF